MRITKIREKTVLLSDEGFILIKKLPSCNVKSALILISSGKILNYFSVFKALGKVFRRPCSHCIKTVFCMNDKALSEAEKDGRSRTDYILDCMSINGGTLTV